MSAEDLVDALVDIIDESQRGIWGDTCNPFRLAEAIVAAGWTPPASKLSSNVSIAVVNPNIEADWFDPDGFPWGTGAEIP